MVHFRSTKSDNFLDLVRKLFIPKMDSGYAPTDLQRFFAFGYIPSEEPSERFLYIFYNNTGNATADNLQLVPEFSVAYKVIATVIHLIIFLLGVVGNSILIFVVLSTKSLQTPTFRYLVRTKEYVISEV